MFYPAMSATLQAFNSGSSSNDVVQDRREEESPSIASTHTETVYSVTGVLREEDIGVTLDYEPPADSTYYADSSSTRREAESRHNENRSSNNYTSRRRQYRRRRRSNENFLRFYSRHWFGQCIAALVTGLIFMTIGVVFVTTDITSAYIGVMFMLVSLPSFFMSLHMVRSRLQQQRLRRMYLERQRRRMARRRRRRGGAEDAAYRSNTLPYADLPPSYDNLGFSDNDCANDVEADAKSMDTSSDFSEGPPPTYDKDWDVDSIEDIEIGNLADESISTENKPTSSRYKTTSETDSSIERPSCSRTD